MNEWSCQHDLALVGTIGRRPHSGLSRVCSAALYLQIIVRSCMTASFLHNYGHVYMLMMSFSLWPLLCSNFEIHLQHMLSAILRMCYSADLGWTIDPCMVEKHDEREWRGSTFCSLLQHAICLYWWGFIVADFPCCILYAQWNTRQIA